MNQKILFWVLVSIVGISGFSQGMLLPLIAVIFENDGVSSTLNGLHATGLYLGVLLASPLMEAPLRKFGYKPLILCGGLAVVRNRPDHGIHHYHVFFCRKLTFPNPAWNDE